MIVSAGNNLSAISGRRPPHVRPRPVSKLATATLSFVYTNPVLTTFNNLPVLKYSSYCSNLLSRHAQTQSGREHRPLAQLDLHCHVNQTQVNKRS